MLLLTVGNLKTQGEREFESHEHLQTSLISGPLGGDNEVYGLLACNACSLERVRRFGETCLHLHNRRVREEKDASLQPV
jgi:hypothetical protein